MTIGLVGHVLVGGVAPNLIWCSSELYRDACSRDKLKVSERLQRPGTI